MSSHDGSERNAPLRTSAREARESRAFDNLYNALGSALLQAHEAFLESEASASDGARSNASWRNKLRIAAAIAMADAADLDDETLAVVAEFAYGCCRDGFTRQRYPYAKDRKEHQALRAIVAERFETVAKAAMAEAQRNARAAQRAEVTDEGGREHLPEVVWGDRDDVLEVACVDEKGRVWGTRCNASPPFHVEHLNRGEEEPRIRIDLEKKGVRAFEVVEGALSTEERVELGRLLTFRDELEDAWLHEMVSRHLVSVHKRAELVRIHTYKGTPQAYDVWLVRIRAYEGTPHAYDVCWTVAELLPEGQWTQALVDDAWVQLKAEPPVIYIFTDAVEPDGVHEFRLAGLLFADVAPAWVIGWRGHEERTRRHRGAEASVLARRNARALAEEYLIAVHIEAWEHKHPNVSPPAEGKLHRHDDSPTRRDAMLALGRLRTRNRSLSFVDAMVHWVKTRVTHMDTIFYRARRRFRAAAPFIDDAKDAWNVVLSPELSEEFDDACSELFIDESLWDEALSLGARLWPVAFDESSADEAHRLSPFALDALTPEFPERGGVTLYVSVGEFSTGYADYFEEPPEQPPRIIVALPRSWKDPLFAEAEVTIDHEPEVRGSLPEPLRARAIAFVREHRQALLDHWYERTTTAELADALAPSLHPSPKETP